MIRVFLIILFSVSLLWISEGQNVSVKDTSYTVWSALKKVKKKYPKVTLAKVDAKGVLMQEDVIFFSHKERDLHADLYRLTKNDKCDKPLVVLIHGGGWRSGNKSMMESLAQKLALQGYVTVAIEYRLSDEATYPAAFNDIEDALDFFKLNAKQFQIDSNQIVLLGCSAGASLASLLAVTSEKHSIKALVNIDGIIDFTDHNESGKDLDPKEPSAGARFFGCTFKQCPEVWKEASAVNHVNKYAPPSLFVNSSISRFHAGRDAYVSVLKANNIYYEIHILNDSPHSFWLFEPWFAETSHHILHFLKIVLDEK
ncbi:alpha/beta fold hydrolase [Carboxylicivirga sp. N1Y90]|uniref:alpha/beta fold hydrolase n=1 Tax=Carboxylicivirga fragile TaxID=3417571 RepID=UPI003D33714E|nr:alpha/beta hydrolase [Marinilabiliaceae bacterium N1Y90]